MSLFDQVTLSIVIILVAVGYFCAGRSWEMRNTMKHWQRGFDAAERIYKPLNIDRVTAQEPR